CHLGASDERPPCICDCHEYVLPPLDIIEHEIPVDHLARTNVETTGQTYLLADSAASLPAAAREKRLTIAARVDELLEILAGYDRRGELDQVIVFCHLNDEQRAIERALTGADVSFASIDGSTPHEHAE